MFRARPIGLQQPAEMHQMKDGGESQLWLFQFRRRYFFIKAWGVVVVGGREILLFTQKDAGRGWGGGGGGRPYQQSRLLKTLRSGPPPGLKDDSAFRTAAAATPPIYTPSEGWGWGGNHSSKLLSSVIAEGWTDAENKEGGKEGG